MSAPQKGKGFTPVDKSKLYDVVEKPTSGAQKGVITRTFATALSWDEAQRKKNELAGRRVSKYVCVVAAAPAPEAKLPDPVATFDEDDRVVQINTHAAEPIVPEISVRPLDVVDADLSDLFDSSDEALWPSGWIPELRSVAFERELAAIDAAIQEDALMQARKAQGWTPPPAPAPTSPVGVTPSGEKYPDEHNVDGPAPVASSPAAS